MNNKTRRSIIMGGASIVILPYIWVPNALAQRTNRISERLDEEETHLIHDNAMSRHLAAIRSSNNPDVDGIAGSTLDASNRVMAAGFSDDSNSSVYAASGYAFFGRSNPSNGDRCLAFHRSGASSNGCCTGAMSQFRGTEMVSMIEGPSVLAMGIVSRAVHEYTGDRNLTRFHCLPEMATARMVGGFDWVNADYPTDLYFSRYAEVGITHSVTNRNNRIYGSVQFTLFSRSTGSLIVSGDENYTI